MSACPIVSRLSWRSAAATLCLTLPLSATAASTSEAAAPSGFQDRLAQEQREVQSRLRQPQWENRWLPPAAQVVAAAAEESADARLQAIVAGCTRQALDRGGWVNPWVDDSRYVAPHALVAVPVGQGVTTKGDEAERASRYAQL